MSEAQSASVQSPARPLGIMAQATAYDPESIFEEFRNPKSTPYQEAMRAISEGKALVEDAWLFCGRYDRGGRLLRECEAGEKPYRMLHVRGHEQYVRALHEGVKARESLRAVEGLYDFQSSSDAGSLMRADPNQYTEFVPLFNGPFNRQQYFDFFRAIARAFEEWNHNPIAKRIVNILAQYALGRGLKIRCKDKKIDVAWQKHAKQVRLLNKLRKFWSREYLVNGELMVDLVTWNSIDSSTIYEIVTDIENQDLVLYYQQMFSTWTQTFAGIDVPGVPGSKDSEITRYIIRQIPYDRVVHIKTECFSNEKRGRSILFSILGWCKRLKDIYNSQAIGEQLRASFIFDDTVKGGDASVQSHAQRYAYMPPPGSVFAHNEAIERKPMAPMTGVTAGGSNVGQEILALIATAVGIPKDHFNVTAGAGGSRATAIVGSEPFTKVIEDLQQDFNDLVDRLIEEWCKQNGIEYARDRWELIFPSVTKDTTSEVLKNIGTAQALGAINKRRQGNMIAAELELEDYNYDAEMEQGRHDDELGIGSMPEPMPPVGRFGPPVGQEQPSLDDNPIHGNGKLDIVGQHKSL